MLKPLFRWPGGKSWLTKDIVPFLDKRFDSYVEPFFVGGALFFGLSPKKAIIADVNKDLIQCYEAVASNPTKVVSELKKLKCGEREYFKIRDNWSPRNSYRKAAKFIYLMQNSWNGLYRVNGQGKFNVPYGKRPRKTQLTEQEVCAISGQLQNAIINCDKFTVTLSNIKENDLVFIDPPYFSNGKKMFRRYNEIVFNEKDQEELAENLHRCNKMGVAWILTNACKEQVTEHYSNFERFEVSRYSGISGKEKGRGSINEYIVLSNSERLDRLRVHLSQVAKQV